MGAEGDSLPSHVEDLEFVDVCCQEFISDLLITFVRSSDQSTLTLRMTEGYPLIISIPLGDEKSKLEYFISPRYIE